MVEKVHGDWQQVSVPESNLERIEIQGGSLYRTWLDGQGGPSVAMVFVPDKPAPAPMPPLPVQK